MLAHLWSVGGPRDYKHFRQYASSVCIFVYVVPDVEVTAGIRVGVGSDAASGDKSRQADDRGTEANRRESHSSLELDEHSRAVILVDGLRRDEAFVIAATVDRAFDTQELVLGRAGSRASAGRRAEHVRPVVESNPVGVAVQGEPDDSVPLPLYPVPSAASDAEGFIDVEHRHRLEALVLDQAEAIARLEDVVQRVKSLCDLARWAHDTEHVTASPSVPVDDVVRALTGGNG